MSASLRFLLIPAALAGASAAAAQAPPTTRLVTCGGADCLLVRGRRASPDAAILINGRPVTPTGGRAWQVRLPVETVRAWSSPFARTLDVAVAGAAGSAAAHEVARLPVGMLARRVELASLVVRAR